MEYLNFEKSGLITILIPLNFLIGEYTLFFRLNGWSRKIIHLITGVIDLFFVVATIASGEHPYYPFVIFGGMLIDAVFSGIIALIISIAQFNKIEFNLFSKNLVSSFVASVLSFIPGYLGIEVHQDKIIIGTIMLLVPGLTVVNATRDMMNSDLLAGMSELFNAIMSALSIAFGVAGALWIFGKI